MPLIPGSHTSTSSEQVVPQTSKASRWQLLVALCVMLSVTCLILLTTCVILGLQRDQHKTPVPMHPVSVHDFEVYASESMNPDVKAFVNEGATTMTTLRDDVAAFGRYRFRPKTMVDVSQVETRVRILNKTVPYPIGICPMTYLRWVRPDGDILTARAANVTQSVHIVSAHTSTTIEDVVAHSNGVIWQEVHIDKDRTLTTDFIRRIEKTGKISAIVVTVDRRSPSIRYNKFTHPTHIPQNVNFPGKRLGDLLNPSQTWDDMKWLVNQTKLPIILKGILRAEDGVRANDYGAAAIIVSTHGGRVFDGLPASLDALAEVVAAVKGTSLEVYMDGGVRTGMDVVKAMLLGAQMVFVGRPIVWGLHHSGQHGVVNVLDILQRETTNTLQMIGAQSPRDLTPDMLIKADSSTDVARRRTEL